jgi:hypothetical protein
LVDSGVALIQAQIICNPALVVQIPPAVVIPTPDSICLQGLHQLAHLMALPQQLVKVVLRQHRHLIHSSDSLHKHVVMTQLMDRQEDLGQIMAPLPQLVLDQIMAPAPQLVTQVQSDEASLTLQPRRLMARRVQQQIMLMEAPPQHLRYSVVSLPLHQQMADSRDQELEDSRDQELEDSRDQAHLMVLLQ